MSTTKYIEVTENSQVWMECNGMRYPVQRAFDKELQQDIYCNIKNQLLDKIKLGYNASIVAYGQTNSGKTYTMFGPQEYLSSDLRYDDRCGIVPRIIKDLYDLRELENDVETQISVSVLEIYQERLKDLCDSTSKTMDVRDGAKGITRIDGLKAFSPVTAIACWTAICNALNNRTIGETMMNNYSSRSHTIVRIKVKRVDLQQDISLESEVLLVDLAGSERVDRTGAVGLRLEEAKHINKSLAALGKVINTLASDSKGHVPYRDSKLTRILKNSLGGNALTLLMITLSPSECDKEESISTLRFGQNAQLIKNKLQENRVLSAEQLRGIVQEHKTRIQSLTMYIDTLEAELTKNGIDPNNISNEVSSKISHARESQAVASLAIQETPKTPVNNTLPTTTKFIERLEQEEVLLRKQEKLDHQEKRIEDLVDTVISLQHSIEEREQQIKDFHRLYSANTEKIGAVSTTPTLDSVGDYSEDKRTETSAFNPELELETVREERDMYLNLYMDVSSKYKKSLEAIVDIQGGLHR